MVENSDNKTEKVEEKKDNTQLKTEDTIKGIIGLIFIGYFAWTFLFSGSSTTSNVSTTSKNKEISAEATAVCEKLVDATNKAFTSNELFRRDATVLKLKAVKANVKYDFGDKVNCELYIKNDGNLIIQAIKGNIYYFDVDDVSDKKMFFVDTVIRPQETIKEEISYLPKNITRIEIRDDDGNKAFEYRWASEYNGTTYNP